MMISSHASKSYFTDVTSSSSPLDHIIYKAVSLIALEPMTDINIDYIRIAG